MQKITIPSFSTSDLMSKKDKYLLALSGGIDSVVLFDILLQGGYSFAVAHCNFKLRGKESDEDEKFVLDMCKKHGISCRVKAFDTASYASKHKISIQMAARTLRYAWFEELKATVGFDFICTAHHKTDVVETMLINLIRGTGIAGLHGIREKKGNLIRPLIFVSKEEIIAYGKQRKLAYREDSSNASDAYMRNKIRHHIIPELKKIDPNYERGFFDTALHIQKSESVLAALLQSTLKKIKRVKGNEIRFNIKQLLSLEEAENFLFEVFRVYNFSSAQCEMLFKSLKKGSGKQFVSSSHRLLIDRDDLVLHPLTESKEKKGFLIKSLEDTSSLPIELTAKKCLINKQFILNKKASVAQFDADKVSFPLELRRWKKGDSFYPLGMTKPKKLSDFFIDHKLSIFDKEEVWLLCSGAAIIWVINLRQDDRFKITSKTKTYFQFEFKHSTL